MRRAVDAWGLKLCAKSPDLYSETVSAVMVPEGFDGTKIVVVNYSDYVFTSTDSGATWTQLSPAGYAGSWRSTAMSSDGT